MNEYAFACFRIMDKSKSFLRIEKRYRSVSWHISWPVFKFGYAYLHIFLEEDLFFLWIGRSIGKIAIFIQIGHHIFQAFASFISLSSLHFLFFVLLPFYTLLFAFSFC